MRGLIFVVLTFFLAEYSSAGTKRVDINDVFQIMKDRIYHRHKYNPSDSLLSIAIGNIKNDGGYDDVDYYDDGIVQWSAMQHIDRLMDMALAYTNRSNRYYGDSALYENIRNGLQYWYDKNPECNNWWYNKVEEPQKIGLILIFLDFGVKSIPQKLRDALIDRMFEDGGNPANYTGANKTDIAMHWFYRAVLLGDKQLLRESLDFLYSPISIDLEEGIQSDGSYFQHGPQLYLGGYADAFLTSVLDIYEYTHGTEYQMDLEKKNILSDFFLRIYLQNIRGQVMNFNSVGRVISRQSCLKMPEIWGRFCDQMKVLDSSNMNLYTAAKERIDGKKDSNYMVAPSHAHLYKGDFTMHIRPLYSFSVKFTSNKSLRTENLNEENIYGYYLSDGSTCLMKSGEEYYDLMPLWNWSYIPGTTAPNNDFIPILKNPRVFGESNFAGGVSDNFYGVSAYRYKDMTEGVNTGCNKAWFFLMMKSSVLDPICFQQINFIHVLNRVGGGNCLF